MIGAKGERNEGRACTFSPFGFAPLATRHHGEKCQDDETTSEVLLVRLLYPFSPSFFFPCSQTKSEKVARKVTATPATRKPDRVRSMSPEEPEQRSAIPLFNTSAKGRGDGRRRAAMLASKAAAAADDDMQVDSTRAKHGSAGNSDQGQEPAPVHKPSMSVKMRRAREQMKLEEDRRKAKHSGGATPRHKGADKFKLGVDYVSLHESRPGGAFKKKLR